MQLKFSNYLQFVSEKPAAKVEVESNKKDEIETSKKAVKKHKKKVADGDDIDEITRKLLDMEVSKTELEKAENYDFTSGKKEKPRKAEMHQLTPITIVRKQIKPTKMIVVEPEQPQNIQLRKTKITPRLQQESKLPTVLLKSRIVKIEYPPTAQKLKITDINAKRAQGDLNRFEEEEEDEKKPKKHKKFKVPKDKKADLEEIELFEEEETPELEDIEEQKTKYERKQKEAPEPESIESKTLKLGKGKVPLVETPEEIVKLKKVAEKSPPEMSVEETIKPKKKEEEIVDVKPKKKSGKQKLEPLEPFEPSEPEPIDKEVYEKSPYEKPKEEKPAEEKFYKRKPKPKSEPEEPEINIVLGKPKPKEELEEPEVKFRIPDSIKPEEVKEPITLKPWTKPDDVKEVEQSPQYDLTIKFEEKPKDDEDFEVAIDETPENEKPKQKRKVKKPKKTSPADDELERLLNLEIEKTELESYEKVDLELPKKLKPEISEEETIKAPVPKDGTPEPKEDKQKEKPVEKVAELKEEVKKKPPRPKKVIEEKPKEESLETILQRKLMRRDFTKESMEEVSQEPQHAKTTDAQSSYESELESIRRKLSKVDSNADSAEETSEASSKPEKKKVRKIKKKNTADMDVELERLLNLEIERTELEQYEKIDIDAAKKDKEEVEQVAVPFKRAEKTIPDEKPEQELVLKFTKKERSETPEIKEISFRKPTQFEISEPENASVTLRKISKPESEPEETTEALFSLKQTPDTIITEDVETVQTVLKKKKKPKVTEEAEAEISVKTQKKPEPEEVKAEITVTKEVEAPTKDIVEDAPQEAVFGIKKPKPGFKVSEETEVNETIKKKKKPKIAEEVEAEADVTIGLIKKPKPIVSEDVEVVETIKKKKKPQVTDTAETEISIKKARNPKSENVDAEATIQQTFEIEDNEPIEILEIEEDAPEEAVFGIKKHKQKSSFVEEAEVVETIKKIKKPKIVEEPEDAAAEATFGLKKKPEPVSIEEVEISETIKKKKKPKVTEEAEAEMSLKKHKKPSIQSEAAEVTVSKTVEVPDEIEEIEEAPEEVVFGLRQPKTRPIISEEDEVVETIKKKKKPRTTEEADTEFAIKRPKKPKFQSADAEAEATITKMIEGEEEEPEIEEIEEPTEDVFFRRRPKTKALQYEEHEDAFTIKKLKKPRKLSRPDFPEITEPENVTFRPKRTTHKEDVDQEFKIKLDSYAEEEISMSGKVKLKKPKPVYSEDAGEHRIRIIQEIEDDEGPIIEEIIDDDSEPEDTMYDVDEPDEFSDKETLPEDLPEHVLLKLKRKKQKLPYKIQDFEEESVSLGLPRKKHRKKISSYDEDSLKLKLKRRSAPKYIEGKIFVKFILPII